MIRLSDGATVNTSAGYTSSHVRTFLVYMHRFVYIDSVCSEAARKNALLIAINDDTSPLSHGPSFVLVLRMICWTSNNFNLFDSPRSQRLSLSFISLPFHQPANFSNRNTTSNAKRHFSDLLIDLTLLLFGRMFSRESPKMNLSISRNRQSQTASNFWCSEKISSCKGI